MRNSYLEYYQLILQKVSFDRRLFHKEYRKAIRTLSHGERNLLDHWIQSMGFGHMIPASEHTYEELAPANLSVTGINNPSP